MCGRTRQAQHRDYTYYACTINREQHHEQPWYPQHPSTLTVREHLLLPALGAFFAERVLGPGRTGLLDQEPAPTELGSHDDEVAALAAGPDGSWAVSGDEVDGLRDLEHFKQFGRGEHGRVRLWHADRPGQSVELGTQEGRVGAVAVSPDGSWVVSAGHYSDRVQLWHLDRPGQPIELGTHHGSNDRVVVAPDGSWLVTAEYRRVRLSLLSAAYAGGIVLPLSARVVAVASSDRGNYLAVGGAGVTVCAIHP